MILPLLQSSFAAGLIATAVMAFFLYLPRTWGGHTFDIIGAIGSAMVGRDNEQARFMGATTYFLVGLLIAVFYGWVALEALTSSGDGLPDWQIFPRAPLEIDLFFPVLGALIGLVHGIVVAILVAVVVIEHHPQERYRKSLGLVPSQLLSHVIYGITVMFFHHQFLQVLLNAAR